MIRSAGWPPLAGYCANTSSVKRYCAPSIAGESGQLEVAPECSPR